ncbi:DUF4169 family protein [Phenylobacterium sp.]|uniref:DUF4169 family protein n=1 Tax=Phenylobacterium sp. TaxID=1871053 RepID=UPI0035B31C5A
MSEPINLNKFRKARAKDEAKKTAEQNRVRFGRTKAEKQVSRLEAEKARRLHEQAKRED